MARAGPGRSSAGCLGLVRVNLEGRECGPRTTDRVVRMPIVRTSAEPTMRPEVHDDVDHQGRAAGAGNAPRVLECVGADIAGARLVHHTAATAAVFPSWAPLNNAILLTEPGADEVAVATELRGVYADAGVEGWALWVPSAATDFETPDEVDEIAGLRRDTTTLVMQAHLPPGLRLHDGVVRTSVAVAGRAGDEPVSVTDLAEPETGSAVAAWVMVHDELAVAGAWSFLHDRDCGIYAVGTVMGWRRRGLARRLVEHILADASRRGARTATLQSTRIGQRLYRSLGFEPAGRYEEWVSG